LIVLFIVLARSMKATTMLIFLVIYNPLGHMSFTLGLNACNINLVFLTKLWHLEVKQANLLHCFLFENISKFELD
jgi:hypothetical protein